MSLVCSPTVPVKSCDSKTAPVGLLVEEILHLYEFQRHKLELYRYDGQWHTIATDDLISSPHNFTSHLARLAALIQFLPQPALGSVALTPIG